MNQEDTASVVSATKAYYDGPADEIYRTVWGDNLHLGVPRSEESSHPEAMEHTNEIMAAAAPLGPGVRVLDLGCGYGSTARYLAANFGCEVTGVNISEKELQLARERSREYVASITCCLSSTATFITSPTSMNPTMLPGARKPFFMRRTRWPSCRNVVASCGPPVRSSSPTSWFDRTRLKRIGPGFTTGSSRRICGTWKITAMP